MFEDVMNQSVDTENSEVVEENSEVDEQGTLEQQGTDNQESLTDDDNQTNEDDSNTDGADNHVNGSDEVSAEDSEPFYTFDDGDVITKADAENYAKIGFQFEKNTLPTLRRLEKIMANSKRADGGDYESFEEFVSTLEEGIDEMLLETCRNDAGGNEEVALELFKSRKALRDSKFEEQLNSRAQTEKENAENKTRVIAEQFEELQKSFPEYKQFSDLPSEVKEIAFKNNISLFDAKLRYDYQNKIDSSKAKEQMQRANNASAGSQSGQGEHSNQEIDDMIAAFRRD